MKKTQETHRSGRRETTMAFGAETIIMNQKKTADYFLHHDAVSPETAIPEEELLTDRKVPRRALGNLKKEQVIRECEKGLYLDRDRWEQFRHGLKRFFMP